MKNIKIATKLILAMVVMLGISLAIGIFGIYSLSSVRQSQEVMFSDNLLALKQIGNIRANYQLQRAQVRDLIIYGNIKAESFQDTLVKLEQSEREMEVYISEYWLTVTDEEDKDAFENFERIYRGEFSTLKQRSIQASQLDNSFFDYLDASRDVADELYDYLQICLLANVEEAQHYIQYNQQIATNMALIEGLFIAIGILAALLISTYLNRRIAKPIMEMLKAAKKLSVGDVNVEIVSDSTDEVGQFADAFQKMAEMIRSQVIALNRIAQGDLTEDIKIHGENDMIGQGVKQCSDNLNRVLWEINSAAGQVSSGAEQVSQSSQILAQGAAEQATAIEQLSSSIYEISLNTKESAKMTDALAHLYKGISNRADQGSDLMDAMIVSIEDVQSATEDISKIMKLMGDISFQTNILSINAAVEAANAGEHGKGFAVVANEVRNLAKKSTQAAADTDDLIETCMKKVALGTSIVKQTHEALLAIVKDIVLSSQHIDDIALASNEQSISIEQINIGIDQVSKVINMNSSSAEQSAMAAEEMSTMADNMAELAMSFRLRHSAEEISLPAKNRTRRQEKKDAVQEQESRSKY